MFVMNAATDESPMATVDTTSQSLPTPDDAPSQAAEGIAAPAAAPSTSMQAAVVKTVTALGYEVVDIERTGGGLLRITIDRMAGKTYPNTDPGAPPDMVNIDDCEIVTRQLQYALEVDNVDYRRLEVSSPGLDRPLRKLADFVRFEGEPAEVTLRMPFQGRKKFRGLLAMREDGGLRLVLDDSVGLPHNPKVRVGKKAAALAAANTVPTLDFDLNEVRDARLVPVVNFKGRSAAQTADDDGGLKA
jgi:ribosome maturation factor RimP